MYNIFFETAATGFMAVLLLYLHIEYPEASESNKCYRRWVAWILASLIIDVISSRMADYGNVIAPLCNTLASTAYFLITSGCYWSLGRYLHSIIRGRLSDAYMRFLNILVIIYQIFMVLNVFGGWVFFYNDEGVYTHGPIYSVILILQILVIALSIALLFSYSRKMEKRQLAAIWLFMAIILSGFILQLVFFPKTLLAFYMFSIAAMMVLFVIETPDYAKLADALDEVEEQRLRADFANQAKSNFLANMSHEIRTPMNAIIGLDEMILRETENRKVRRFALDIRSAGNTLLSIINDILDLSKIESGRMELVPVKYDFSSVLNDVVNMTMKKAQEKGLSYDLDIDPGIPSVLYGDEIRIRQIILNITNNAIKYTEEGGIRLAIAYDRSESRLTCSVKDTGMGIKEEDLEKLFSSFQRLDETRNRNIEGTGLGLNITKQLAELMGGSIRVKSAYGKGSEFIVEVQQETVDDTPIGDYREHLAKAMENNEEYSAQLAAPDAKILIVDDNEMNLEVITELLGETGIKVTTAVSGQGCIDALKENTFDLLLLDQMMPKMSGTQTLAVIKEEHLADGIPVIVLTADAIVGAKDNYIKAGFTDYLSKPIMYTELEETLRKYLDPGLILTKEQAEAEKQKRMAEDHRPVALVVCDSSEKLSRAKSLISSEYKGVYVKNEAQARRYLEKHKVEFVVRDMMYMNEGEL